MSSLHRVLFVGSVCGLVLLCAGMYWRRRLTQCVTFSAYVIAATVFSVVYLVYPASNTPEAFVVKQGIYDSLLFGMSLEISYRAFSAFAGIANQVRGLLALAVAASSLAIFLLTPPNPLYADIARYQPGITTAGIWCLSFVAMLIVWYQIPVPAFTRSIILGYVPYQVVFVVCTDFIGRLGWGAIQGIDLANALAFDAVAGYLAFNSWRKD